MSESGGPTRAGAERQPDRVRRVDSAEIFRAARELVIRHAGEDYRLQITRNNKLILTK